MKKISKLLCCLLVILFLFVGCTSEITETTTSTTEKETTTESSTTETKPVVISEEVVSMSNDTKEKVNEGKSLDTSGMIKNPDESSLENDASVSQENVSYDGTSTGNGVKLLGKCTGLTYYNQGDSRWANRPYTSSGNRSQTIKSSGCGPTSAAMVVSSSKGAILPTTMAKLFVDNGYRTKSNGTAWSAWSFVADYFNFKEYHTTNSVSKMLIYLKSDKNKDGVSDYFVVASCNSGLFTTSGHYIVLVADDKGTITVYDPYLYSGKFNTPSRKAANVKVSGNSAYVSEKNFKKYGNTVSYWIFSNDFTKKKATSTKKNTTSVNYTRYVSTSSQGLNVRSSYPSGKIIKVLNKGSKVKVTKVANGWSYITSPAKGWVSSKYLSSTKVNTTSAVKKIKYVTKVNKLYRLKSDTTLYSKGSLSGTKYQYKKLTQVKVVSHYSSKVDKVKVVKTGRVAYVKVSNLK